ncbi:kinase-like domain-containing protein [Mycena capillaripes]|nr:kinase-like domain-containing protein [Mycena capillaripes]
MSDTHDANPTHLEDCVLSSWAIWSAQALLLDTGLFFKLGFGSFSTVWLAHDSVESHGIAHGDLYPANFGIAVPEIHRFDELGFWHQATPPPLRAVIPFSPHCDPHSYPPYLSGNLDLGEFLGLHAPDNLGRPLSVRIFDFGGAYVVDGSAPPRPVTPPFYAAPEIVFPQVALNEKDPQWDQRSHIWSLGVAFHDLVGAGGLFPELLVDDTELPHYMVYFTPDMTEEFWDGRTELFAQLGVEDPPGFVRLMRRMLVLDTAKRPSAQELLDDPIPHGKEADLQTNRPNLPTFE